MVLNEEQWIKELREKRIAYGISQGRLAVASGITREYLNKIESGKMKPSKELLETLHKELARFNPEAPLTMLFDYVKIRFPTLDIQHIIKDILKLNINYMLHEDYGHYSYTEHYSLGDIFIYTSADEEKGVLLELKGRGCRQFESYLLAQQRSWYDFLMDALVDGGVMKRIDLAINDHTGILDIPELAEKCRKREYIGKSRSYKFYQSGELIKHREDDREYMGRTLYLGSLKSDVYFCIYEKDYEQYVKLGTPLEEADIINRFEIRLRNERAYYAVRDLLTYYDAEQTAFSIINQYVRFVDEEPDKRKNDWKLNDRWAWFIGDNRQSLKLTTKPEPYTLDRTLRWVQRQVAPTLKMLKKIDKGNGTDYMETIEQQAKLTEKHEMIIKQQTTPAKDLGELLSESNPSSVISVLLEKQEQLLQNEVKERQEQLAMLEGIKKALKGIENFSVESIGDIAYAMENKKKMKQLHAVLLITGIPLNIIQWVSIILWITTGIQWLFWGYILVAIPYAIFIIRFLSKRIVYICPQCHEIFKPHLKEFIFSNHSMTLRKLTCTSCGYHGFCVETYREEEKNNE